MEAREVSETVNPTGMELDDVRTGYLKKMGVLTTPKAEIDPTPVEPPAIPHHFKEPAPLKPIQRVEHALIDTIETIVMSMDNITTIQAFFPNLLNYRALKPVNWGVQQVNKLYILYLLLQLRKSMGTHFMISRLQRFVKGEWAVLDNYNDEIRLQMRKQLVEWSRGLQNEMWKCKVCIVTYLVDLVLNIGLVFKRGGGKTMKLLAALSYLLGLFKSTTCGDRHDGEAPVLLELKSRYHIS